MQFFTGSDIVHDLRSLGLEAGDTVMVHSSLGALVDFARLNLADALTSPGMPDQDFSESRQT